MSPPCVRAPALQALAGVDHGFFGRQGGVSLGDYAGLNVGPGSSDDPASVRENRRRLGAALGVGEPQVLSVYQVHSARAVCVAGPWAGERPEADAMATASPGLALTILTADCAPVLLADPKAQVIGAAHAGWRGALLGVLEAVVAAMEHLGARPGGIVAAVGPCIAQASYEVGPELVERFCSADPNSGVFFQPGRNGRSHFDLSGYCVTRLQQSGVNQVTSLGLDTYTQPRAYFSHRRNTHESLKDYGRNGSAIVLAPS